jgi:rSAM/selenodomain-associated transferase 1
MTENRYADAVVLFFMKAPVRGLVKSRLARAIGADAALELHRRFILDMLEMLKSLDFPLVICFDPPDAGAYISEWLGAEHRYLPQEGSDLGLRMEHSFQRVFSRNITRAILIGSDIPDLPPGVITDAFASLEKNDVVLGPAADGGYYLIGFRTQAFLPSLFHCIPWSEDAVFQTTMERLYAASRSVHLLPLWRDVDTLDDLNALSDRNRTTSFRHSRTMAYLRKMKGQVIADPEIAP